MATVLDKSTPQSSSSILEKLFKQTESPEQTEDRVNQTTKNDTLTNHFYPLQHSALLGDLRLLQELTQELQAATSSTTFHYHVNDFHANEQLALLYCRRAAALVAFVDFDATALVPVATLVSNPSSDTVDGKVNQMPPLVEAVRQALDDAQAATALASNNATRGQAHLLAAYCSRSLGELVHAQAFAARALTALPESPVIIRLIAQLDVEARGENTDYWSPKLQMTANILSTLIRDDRSGPYQKQGSDNNDLPIQSTAPGSFWNQVAAHFKVLETAANATWLAKAERLMHQTVHHCCALPTDVCQLEASLQSTLGTLAFLLQSHTTCTLLKIDMTDELAAKALEKISQAAATTSETLVQSRTSRTWLVHTLAPAVFSTAVSSSSPLVIFFRDVFLMLTRFLQALGSWRGCTAMPYSSIYVEMSYELAKQWPTDVYPTKAWTRLTMQCAEAYATSLVQQRTDQNKALLTFRGILQTALDVGDHDYELRARLLLAQTLRLMDKVELAQAELEQFRMRSRSLNDVYCEAVAEYEIGVLWIQKGAFEKAHEHFHIAQRLCNETGNCGNSWRPRSIQHAIAFYARLQPTTRRGAIHGCSAKRVESIQEKNEVDEREGRYERETLQDEEGPMHRRKAIWGKQSHM